MGNSSLRVIFSVQVLWCSLISYLYSAMMCLHLALDLALKLSRSVLPSFFHFFFSFFCFSVSFLCRFPTCICLFLLYPLSLPHRTLFDPHGLARGFHASPGFEHQGHVPERKVDTILYNSTLVESTTSTTSLL